MKRPITYTIIILLFMAGVIILAASQAPRFSGVAQAQAPHKPQKEIVLVVEKNINGETISGEVRLEFEDAPEIPGEAPDVFGLFLERDGDNIILGTGAIDVEVSMEVVNNQEPIQIVSASHSGGEIAFQVNDQTIYLKDTSVQPEITAEHIQAGELIIPGTVAPGSLSEIGPNMVLRVWGVYRSGVLVAELVVYEILQ
jgi:hypothetical protein